MSAMVDLATARANAVLNGLPDDLLTGMLPAMLDVPLPRGEVLYRVGGPVSAVHFPTVGVISMLQEVDDQDLIEIATVGPEGMTGIAVFLGGTPTERAMVQISGRAVVISSDAFRQHLSTMDGPLHDMLRRYTHALFAQLGRNAACNRSHPVRRRAARWLLMC